MKISDFLGVSADRVATMTRSEMLALLREGQKMVARRGEALRSARLTGASSAYQELGPYRASSRFTGKSLTKAELVSAVSAQKRFLRSSTSKVSGVKATLADIDIKIRDRATAPQIRRIYETIGGRIRLFAAWRIYYREHYAEVKAYGSDVIAGNLKDIALEDTSIISAQQLAKRLHERQQNGRLLSVEELERKGVIESAGNTVEDIFSSFDTSKD